MLYSSNRCLYLFCVSLTFKGKKWKCFLVHNLKSNSAFIISYLILPRLDTNGVIDPLSSNSKVINHYSIYLIYTTAIDFLTVCKHMAYICKHMIVYF